MIYPSHVREYARKLDPDCWKQSFSGRLPFEKTILAERRVASLKKAKLCCSYSTAPRVWSSRSSLSPAASSAEIEMKNYVRNYVREFMARHGKHAALKVIRIFQPQAASMSEIPTDRWPGLYSAFRVADHNLQPKVPAMAKTFPVLKIQMMLHFASVVGPFAPEHTRRSEAYTTFVKELLRDELIVRPTPKQREANPGWAYQATEKGRVYVDALKAVALPVATTPRWVMPK